MKTEAALFVGTGLPLELREIELRDPRRGEVLVRMAAVGICGTDLHVVNGEWDRPKPMVLGHEGSGVVETVGEGVTNVRPGDHVVLSWAAACGHCSDCLADRPAACPELQRAIATGTLPDGTTGMERNGEPVYRGTVTGALSRRLVVSAEAALPLRDGIPLEEAALLGCAALTGVGAVLYQARPQQGASVLVLGAGGVGQFCVQAARVAGAATILCVDPNEGRLEQARRLGATHVATTDELDATLRSVAPDGVDVSLDAVGSPQATACALRATRNRGRCVVVGLAAAGDRLDLEPAEFVRREKVLTGSMYGSRDPRAALPALLDLVARGEILLAPLLGPSYPIEQVNEAFRASLAGPPGRVIVTL